MKAQEDSNEENLLKKTMQEREEINIMAKTRYFFKQIRDNNELFHAKRRQAYPSR